MKIELLYIEGCPNVTATLDRVNDILRQRGFDSTVDEIMVGDYDTAVAMRFLGSPTVRINGLDIEPSARQRTTFGMMCRTYEGSGVPSKKLIERAITKAAASST